MKNQVDAYIGDHETAWAPSTIKSERSRLRAIAHLLDGKPEDLYSYLNKLGQKPYTIKTTFIRICAMEKWSQKGTRFCDWMKKHENRFKHSYQKEEVDISYDEALTRINSLDIQSRGFATSLLITGLRISEAYSVADGRVVGKGGKSRKVYGRIEGVMPKSSFASKLREVGLKPHTLRKLCATRLAENGATPADLCKIFGWASIGTAYQYLQAKEEDKIAALMEACSKGS